MASALAIAGTTAHLPVPGQQSQTPVFRGRLDVVRTEVAVIDNRTGKPVANLTAKDFTVFEDGVHQDIASFADLRRQVRTTQRFEVDGRSAPLREDRRIFLLALGAGHLPGPVKPHEGAVRFLREQLGPSDLAAVLVWNRVTAFTTEHERLIEIIKRVEQLPPEVFVPVRRDAMGGRDFSPDTQAAIDRWLAPVDRDGFLRSAAGLLAGTNLYAGSTPGVPWNRRIAANDLLKVYAGIEYLRRMEGRKHLVLLSWYGLSPPWKFIDPGAFLQSADDDRRLAAHANDAGVALHIIHTIGTDLAHFSTMSSQAVARESGGQFTSVRTAAQQLERIDEATRAAYLIGYVPTNPNMDNRYRTVDIRVDRRDVTVVYRRGYTARPDPPAVDPAELMARLRMGEAATTDLRFDDLDVSAEATASGTGDARQVRVAVRVAPAKLALSETAGRWTGAIDLMILSSDARGRIVGTLNQHMTLDMSQTMYEQARATGIPYATAVPVRGAATRVKVIVYNYESDRLGVTSVTVK